MLTFLFFAVLTTIVSCHRGHRGHHKQRNAYFEKSTLKQIKEQEALIYTQSALIRHLEKANSAYQNELNYLYDVNEQDIAFDPCSHILSIYIFITITYILPNHLYIYIS